MADKPLDCIGTNGPTGKHDYQAITPPGAVGMSGGEKVYYAGRSTPAASDEDFKALPSSGKQDILPAFPLTWQLIETAPQDGTEILLAERDGDGIWFQTVGFWDEDRPEYIYKTKWRASEYSAFNHIPSHWMPLPAPPVTSGFGIEDRPGGEAV